MSLLLGDEAAQELQHTAQCRLHLLQLARVQNIATLPMMPPSWALTMITRVRDWCAKFKSRTRLMVLSSMSRRKQG
jgi:hypothetical protein